MLRTSITREGVVFAGTSAGIIVAAVLILAGMIAHADGGRQTFALFVAEVVGAFARLGGVPALGLGLLCGVAAWVRRRRARRWVQNCGRAFALDSEHGDPAPSERPWRNHRRASHLLIALSASLIMISMLQGL